MLENILKQYPFSESIEYWNIVELSLRLEKEKGRLKIVGTKEQVKEAVERLIFKEKRRPSFC